MRKALIPGSFDPVTLGHLNLICRAEGMFDEVTVGIFINPEKEALFTNEERLELIRLATHNLGRVRLAVSGGYTADFAREGGYAAIVRGYRTQADLAYEQQMANFNRQRGGIDTLLLKAPDNLSRVSSSLVRERLRRGEDVSGLVPPASLDALLSFYRAKAY